LWNYLKLKKIIFSNEKINLLIPKIFLLLIFIQILFGAFVSGMDAGKIYNSWPLMNSSYFPDDNEISNLFNLSAFSDPSLVQFIHRNLAYLILLVYIIILINIYKKKLTNFFYIVNLLGILLILQIILGIFTLLYGAQIILSSVHQINSIFLVSASIYFLYLNSNTN
jgi:cytochrome c oxidase assembly protein subunit 15